MRPPVASIWVRGQICINYAAIIKYNLEKFKYVVLYHDTNKIGIEFTSDGTMEGAIKLRIINGMRVFSARSFLKTFKIDFSKTKNMLFRMTTEIICM